MPTENKPAESTPSWQLVTLTTPRLGLTSHGACDMTA
jgi:hypothetical protein